MFELKLLRCFFRLHRMSIHAIVNTVGRASTCPAGDRHRRGARRVAYLRTYTRDPREVVRVGTCKLALFMIHMPTGVVGACGLSTSSGRGVRSDTRTVQPDLQHALRVG